MFWLKKIKNFFRWSDDIVETSLLDLRADITSLWALKRFLYPYWITSPLVNLTWTLPPFSQCQLQSYSVISFTRSLLTLFLHINTLRPRKNGRHFPDDHFKCIFLNENVWILIKISLKFVPKGPINNNPALVQIMAWRRPGDKPLSEPRMDNLLTRICVTRPQWVNQLDWKANIIDSKTRQN